MTGAWVTELVAYLTPDFRSGLRIVGLSPVWGLAQSVLVLHPVCMHMCTQIENTKKKVIYEISTATIILNSKRQKVFSKINTRSPLSPPLFNIILELLAEELGKEKKIQIGKEKKFCSEMTILDIESPKDFTKTHKKPCQN